MSRTYRRKHGKPFSRIPGAFPMFDAWYDSRGKTLPVTPEWEYHSDKYHEHCYRKGMKTASKEKARRHWREFEHRFMSALDPEDVDYYDNHKLLLGEIWNWD